MESFKREAQSLPTNEKKRPCNDLPLVKKINFNRCNSKCAIDREDVFEGGEIQTNCSSNRRRKTRSRRVNSQSSFCTRDVGPEKMTGISEATDVPHVSMIVEEDEKDSSDVLCRSEHKGVCNTPRGHDMVNGFSPFSKSFHMGKHSPFGTGVTSLINNSSFYEDDVALASLNLSEIITSSCSSSNDLVDDSCQFYGLPMKVKEMLRKFKGIETLYGKAI